MLAAALAATVITEKAPDGVNTVTKTVDDNGYVISESQTLVHVPQKYNPSTQVYRLERNTETEDLYLVGQDMVKRRVCLVDPFEYAMMTGQLAQVWKSMHKDDAGRSRLHGKRGATEIDTTNGVKVTVYEDGYRHVEHFDVKTKRTMDSFAGRKPTTIRDQAMKAVRDKRISERQQKMRDEIEARKKSAPKIITIEHDAVSGKDEVK